MKEDLIGLKIGANKARVEAQKLKAKAEKMKRDQQNKSVDRASATRKSESQVADQVADGKPSSTMSVDRASKKPGEPKETANSESPSKKRGTRGIRLMAGVGQRSKSVDRQSPTKKKRVFGRFSSRKSAGIDDDGESSHASGRP